MLWRVFSLVYLLGCGHASFLNVNRQTRNTKTEGCDCGDPLFLTPYIEEGNAFQGRIKASVPPLLDYIQSYSGFLTVNKTTDSNLFFWYFPAEENTETAPVVVWLQGGPGASSLYALFTENGPFELGKDLKLKRKTHYWTKHLNVIYIDNPVGTGFSFTKNGYARSESDVGRDLYTAVQQFFELFPELRANDFFITGESYAGKYIPAFAYTIHKDNPAEQRKINLKGIAIGNGWVDPANMIDYARLLFAWGFIDLPTRNRFTAVEADIKTLLRQRKFHEAFKLLDIYIDGDLHKQPTMVTNATGITYYYNILQAQNVDDDAALIRFLNQSSIRSRIHVGNLTFSDGNPLVEEYLLVDTLLSIVPWLEVLMDHYRVLLYNGQLDLICAYELTLNYVRQLKWKGAADYAKATRQKWFVGKQLAGYSKTSGNFTEVLVRNAGHMVPADQPEWALDLILKFTTSQPLNNKIQ